MASSKRMMTFELLDRMSKLIGEAKTIPIYNRIMLEKEEFTSLIRRLNESIPPDMQSAQAIIDQEERILGDSRKIAEETTAKANSEAQATVANAQAKADTLVTDAQNRANETIRGATDQANAMIADAQARANARIADAQARAQQMVAESEIVARAQAEAQEMLESTHRDCEEFTGRAHDAVNQLLEQTDMYMTQQLDSLRAAREQFANQ